MQTSFIIVVFLTMSATFPPGSAGRKIHGWTRAEWRDWMQDFSVGEWASECSKGSRWGPASWYG